MTTKRELQKDNISKLIRKRVKEINDELDEHSKIDELKMWKKKLIHIKDEIDELENNKIEVEYYIEDLEKELERFKNQKL